MLSVIIPLFEAKDYIEKCVGSVLDQSYKDIEVIIVDDESQDGSLDLCYDIQKKDKRVKILTQVHAGPSAARARGIEAAEGEYITFIDADDFIDKTSYVLAKEDMESDIDVISFGIYRYFDDDDIRTDFDDKQELIYGRKSIEKEIFPDMLWNKEKNGFGIDPSLCTKIFKKNLIKDIFELVGNVSFHYGEDVAIIYPLIKNANSFSVHREAYYYHRLKKNVLLPPYIKELTYLEKLFDLYTSLLKTMKENCFREQIELFYAYSVQLVKKRYGINSMGNADVIFPFGKVSREDRVIIYGAGDVGNTYIKQLENTKYCDVVLWVDINHAKLRGMIEAPESIVSVEYDFVVIAIMSKSIRDSVAKYLMGLGVPREKII